jgi:MraZ protein
VWGSPLATLRVTNYRLLPSGTARGGELTVFCGDSTHTVDAKHRVFLPKRFQLELPLDEEGGRVAILTRGLDDCLYLFSEAGFQRALERMDTQTFTGPEQRILQRLFFSHVHKLTLDSSGRVLLPEKLRKLVGIQKEIQMVGIYDRVEIWAHDRWEAFEEANADAFGKLESVLTGVASNGSVTSGDAEGSDA